MKGFGLRRLLFPIGIFAATQFMSCKTDDAVEDLNGTSDVPKERKEEPSLNYRALFSTHHTIGEEEAKELALDASSLFSRDGNGLRSGRMRQICDVRVLHSEESILRSGSGEEMPVPDTLAYVCNFADSAGFAIICADDRVGCPILAYVGEGMLGEEVDNPGLAIILSNMEDYLIGSIRQFENEKDSLRQKAEAQLQDDTTCLKRVYTGKYDLISEESVAPLIYTKWDQWPAPYNTYMPYYSSTDSHAPAGCVAVATAQIMAHYEYPESLDGYTFDWKGMKVSPSAEEKKGKVTPQNQELVARLMQSIGNHVGMDYGFNESSANTATAVSWLGSLGYKTASSGYSWDFAKTYLDEGVPLIMRGYNKKTLKKKKFLWIPVKSTPIYSDGHAWIVDGYKTTTIKSYSYTVDSDKDVTTTRYLSTSYSNSFLSVNWGWGGESDSYYAADCFAPKGSDYNFQYGQELFVVRR